MVRNCTVCSLTNSQPSPQMYGLPKDETTAARILHQLGFDSSFVPNNSFKICEKHFASGSFKMWGSHKTLNDDPVVAGFEKTELTRDMLRVGDGKLYKLVEAPNQDQLGKKVMILKEATPPPKPLPIKTRGSVELKAEFIKLKRQLRKEQADVKKMRNDLDRLFKMEQKKNSFSVEFNEKLQSILNPVITKPRQSARLQSQSDQESESEEESEEPSPKRTRTATHEKNGTAASNLLVVRSVKEEPNYELEEHLYEDENETPSQLEEFTEEPKSEAY